MKNLLETEFVIENCSLGQRAAIKHYCEEKGIKQLDLETPKFNVVTSNMIVIGTVFSKLFIISL